MHIPKIHDLPALLSAVPHLEPLWVAFLPGLKKLTVAAVVTRYPGRSETKQSAREMLAICKEFRAVARQSLGL